MKHSSGGKDTLSGKCHCGAIGFHFAVPLSASAQPSELVTDHGSKAAARLTSGMRCDCSICRRKGIVLTDFVVSPEDANIVAEDGVIGIYEFGTKVAKHCFCTRCGIQTFVKTRLNPGKYRFNLGCVDEIDIFRLALHTYDGKRL